MLYGQTRCSSSAVTTSRPARRKGAAVVEFALVVPVFFLFILGVVEVGRGLMVSHLLGNAAREGCRYGIIGSKSSDQIRTVVVNKLAAQGIQGCNSAHDSRTAAFTSAPSPCCGTRMVNRSVSKLAGISRKITGGIFSLIAGICP